MHGAKEQSKRVYRNIRQENRNNYAFLSEVFLNLT